MSLSASLRPNSRDIVCISYDFKASMGEGLGTLSVTALELGWGVEPALYLCLCDSMDSGSATIYSSQSGLSVRVDIVYFCATHTVVTGPAC